MKFTLHLTEFGLFMMLRNLILLLILSLSLHAAENIKAVGAVSKANIKAIGAVAEANVKAFGVVDNTGGGFDTVTFDAAGNSSATAVATYTFSHTASGANRVLLVGVAIRNNPSDGVTVSSVACSNAVSGAQSLTKLRHDNGSIRARTEIWYLVAPHAAANTIHVTLSGTPEVSAAGAVSFNGVDQTTPMDVAGGAGANGESTESTGSITTATAGAWTFAVTGLQFSSTLSIGANQTQRWDVDLGAIANGQTAGGTSSAAVSPSGSKTHNWTWTGTSSWSLSIAAVRPRAL